jgi:outer membrane lipoprotein-sorting protein
LAASCTVAVAADAPPPGLPAFEAFKKANDAVKSYTETIVAHEVKDGRVEDRTYHYSFEKPNLARTEIVSGPGSGGAAVWKGGDTVRGHQGGFFRGIKLTLSIHDGRATDLRGKTIDAASYPAIIASLSNDGKLSEEPGQPVAGVATDDVVLVPADPTKIRNLTKDVIVLSRDTHLPLEHLGYEGTQVVEDEKFTDLKLNPDLPEGTFEM